MIIHKAYRYKMEPTEQQRALLYRMVGCGRFVYNASLDLLLDVARKELAFDGERKLLYDILNDMKPADRIALARKMPTVKELSKYTTQWKKTESRAFLAQAYTDNLQQRQRDLRDRAVKDWCSGKRGFPHYRTRKLAHHSTLRFVNFPKYCVLDRKHIKLPNQLGRVRYRHSRAVEGTPRSCTVTLDACGSWHVSILCEVEIKPSGTAVSAIGIDMGIARNMTLSNGDYYKGVASFNKRQVELAKAQRKQSRMELGSANWQKQRKKIARLHRRIANIRMDYQHKHTTLISKNHAMVVVEDLRVSNMSKSAKGSVAQPGRKVRQKAGLNRSILDQGWHTLRQMLAYKMSWNGGIFLAVPAQYTSQTCPACQHIAKESRKTQAVFSCVQCGNAGNADVIAAQNILNRGMKILQEKRAGHARIACEVNGAVMPSAAGTNQQSNQLNPFH